MPEITTARLILRKVERQDALDLLAVYADQSVMFGQSAADMLYTADDVLKLIDYELTHYSEKAWALTVIERKSDEALIGVISVNEANQSSVDIAYYLKQSAWHQGYMKEALTAYCADLFQRVNVSFITAQYRCDNFRSAAVLKACGFRETGVIESVLLNDYKYHDASTCILTNEAFETMKSMKKKQK